MQYLIGNGLLIDINRSAAASAGGGSWAGGLAVASARRLKSAESWRYGVMAWAMWAA
jgi:hypothetical protein